MASLRDRSVLLRRQKWLNADQLAEQLFLILRDETEDTSSTTSTSSATVSSATISGTSSLTEFTLVFPHYDKDYLECTDPNGETVYLAKPALFRPSVWQNAINVLSNVVVGTRLCNLTITFFALVSDENQRLVQNRNQLVLDATDVIETIFTESILPFYKVGDTVYGIRFPAGFSFTGGDGGAVEWLDINADGRSWRPDSSLQLS